VFRSGNDDDRLGRIRRGGKVVVERPMAPQFQTPRWRNLRDMIASERLHLPATDAGEKAARQLARPEDRRAAETAQSMPSACIVDKTGVVRYVRKCYTTATKPRRKLF
jgi:hypothetical protein